MKVSKVTKDDNPKMSSLECLAASDGLLQNNPADVEQAKSFGDFERIADETLKPNNSGKEEIRKSLSPKDGEGSRVFSCSPDISVDIYDNGVFIINKSIHY